MDVLKQLSNAYNLPIWGLYRVIWSLADEIVRLRRQVAERQEKAV